jgi:hypothetical protein
MLSDINLLPKKENIPDSLKGISMFLNIAAVISLILFIGLSVGLFGYKIYFTALMNQRKNRINQFKTEIQKAKPVESIYIALVKKLEAMNQIFSLRFATVDYLNKIIRCIPEDGDVSNISMAPNEISFTMIYEKVNQLEDSINLIKDEFDVKLTDILVKTVEKSKEKPYQTEIVINLVK